MRTLTALNVIICVMFANVASAQVRLLYYPTDGLGEPAGTVTISSVGRSITAIELVSAGSRFIPAKANDVFPFPSLISEQKLFKLGAGKSAFNFVNFGPILPPGLTQEQLDADFGKSGGEGSIDGSLTPADGVADNGLWAEGGAATLVVVSDNPSDVSNNDKRDREIASFKAEVEQEIARREKQADFACDTLDAYRQGLITEYHKNADELLQIALVDQPVEDKVNLERRQKLIALYLWELDRIEPLVTAKVIPCRDLREKVRERMKAATRGDSGRGLQEQLGPLYAKLRELERREPDNRRAMMRNRHGGFYEVQPEFDDDELPAVHSESSVKFESGAMQDIRHPLRRLLKLRWRKGSLVLDRDHWNDLFAGKTLNDVSADVRRDFKERGVELPQQEDHRHGPPRRESAESSVAIPEPSICRQQRQWRRPHVITRGISHSVLVPVRRTGSRVKVRSEFVYPGIGREPVAGQVFESVQSR